MTKDFNAASELLPAEEVVEPDVEVEVRAAAEELGLILDLLSTRQQDLDKAATAASTPATFMPIALVQHDVEVEVKDIVEELVQTLELVQEEEQEAARAAQAAPTPETLMRMPIEAVQHHVEEVEVLGLVEELIQTLELLQEEEQEVPAPAVLQSSTTGKKALRWIDQIATVKHYEVTMEERRYKRSLLDYIKCKGPSPWADCHEKPTPPDVQSVPRCRPQRQRDNVQVMMPSCS